MSKGTHFAWAAATAAAAICAGLIGWSHGSTTTQEQYSEKVADAATSSYIAGICEQFRGECEGTVTAYLNDRVVAGPAAYRVVAGHAYYAESTDGKPVQLPSACTGVRATIETARDGDCSFTPTTRMAIALTDIPTVATGDELVVTAQPDGSTTIEQVK